LSQRVFITGIGLISSIGNSVEENWNSLVNDKRGIRKAKYVDSKLIENFLFGEVNLSNDELKKVLNLPLDSNYARTTLLAMVAVNEAMFSAKIDSSKIDGIIMGCTVSSMCETKKLYENAQAIDNQSNLYDRYDIGSVAMEISELIGDVPFHNTINTACSSSANAIMQGIMMIRSGRAKRLLVGGADALSKYTINGFNSMMLLSNSQCKPFSKDRDGINLGEGAGYLILEGEDFIEDRKPLAEVSGFGNANDSYHATSTSPDGIGPTKAMQTALNNAGVSPNQIDYINAHGTGTENNDETEYVAMKNVFDALPPYSSTKIFTGHTLGAAGAIEAIFCVLMLLNNTIIGNSNKDELPDEKIQLIPTKTLTGISLNRILTNSFGFGGNCTSLLINKVND